MHGARSIGNESGKPWLTCDYLCYLPIPRGLIVNTIFWAGAWWIALFGLTTFKRRRRLRRGRCANCAYDLRGIPTTTSPTCPECGHDAPSPHRKDFGNAPSPVAGGGGGTRSVTEGVASCERGEQLQQ